MNKKFLLEIARRAIQYKLENKELKLNNLPKELLEKRSCFVTLEINNKLRGCIGTLYPTRELYKEIIHNAISAAFNDPRFPPLTKEELNNIKIEISILTTPKKLEYKDKQDLLNKLNKNQGIIIKKNNKQATFLPQVWEQVNNKEEFLSHLCMKAGLNLNEWENNTEVYIYEVEYFKEI